ncbi:malate dehydrogenase, cytoplasmic-like isoform X3 [Chiloscyllium punctatum]|uniref:malate dehydrogenase, cytoplasmic-like isoform X3 n=1 Tax=Chiloscyllium punctatum TaxID=137246 RepID=UPI003B638C37
MVGFERRSPEHYMGLWINSLSVTPSPTLETETRRNFSVRGSPAEGVGDKGCWSACLLPARQDSQRRGVRESAGVTVTDRAEVAFMDVDVAILLGATPRAKDMEWDDQFKCNVRIFRSQGKALDTYAKKTVKVLVVGSPANTNCLIAMTSAPSIPPENFSCLTRLSQNRAQSRLALTLGVGAGTVRNVIVWGAPSGTQLPDIEHASVTCDSRPAGLHQALRGADRLAFQQQRETAVWTGCTMSVASAICDHLRALWSGTPEGELVSMGVISNGNTYGVPEQLIYSFPVTVKDGSWQIVAGLRVSEVCRLRMAQSAQQLLEERKSALRALARSNL